MRKKILFRGTFGSLMGITVGYLITIVTSLIWADGYYISCMPQLVEMMGSEIYAVILQTILCGLLGAVFSAASVIWEQEDWSLVKQTGIYFLIVSVVMLPIAYFAYWMEHSLRGFISYFGVYLVLFVGIWIAGYVREKRNVDKMNARLWKENC